MITPKHVLKERRKARLRKSIRKKIFGTPQIPRMIIVKSNKYLYAQVYDDENHKVVTSASTLEKELKSRLKSAKDREAAKLMGTTIAERLKKLKIKTVAFDRNLYPYMGRVKEFAEAAREKGIVF